MSNENEHEAQSSRRRFLQAAGLAAVGGGLLSGQGAANAAASTPQGAARSATQTDYDVNVVGGGFSGVTAARDLSRSGHRTLLLEARNRIGGRTFDTHFGDQHVELGGTWVHWTQPHVWNEVTRYGLEIKETPGATTEHMIVMVDGKPTEFAVRDRYEELVQGFHAYFEESRLLWERPWDTHFRWREIAERDATTAADGPAGAFLGRGPGARSGQGVVPVRPDAAGAAAGDQAGKACVSGRAGHGAPARANAARVADDPGAAVIAPSP